MPNSFKVGDTVKTVPGVALRFNGKVLYLACRAATVSGGKACDRKTCTHAVKDYVWVLWPGLKSSYSYVYTDLTLDAAAPGPSGPTCATGPTGPQAGPSETEAPKKAYMDSAKKAIEKLTTKAAPELNDWWNTYNGFSKVKHDRYGRSFIQHTPENPPPQLTTKEIDWDVYNGFKKGALKKVDKPANASD